MGVKKRLLWPDLIRVVAIFLMVVLHISAMYAVVWNGQSRLSWWGANLIDSYSRICVPLFIMLSGSLLLGKKKSLKEFYFKRVQRLVKPWLFWSLIYGVINFLQGNEATSLKRLVIGTVWTGFWILPLLLSIYLVTPFFNYLLAKNEKVFISNYLFGMGFFMIMGGHFPLYFEYSFYFVLGYLLSKIKISKQLFNLSFVGMVLSWITIAGLTNYLSVANKGLILDYYHFHTWPVLLLSMLSFIFLKGLAERHIKRKEIKKVIRELSIVSFGIYFIHMLVFKININLVYFPSYIFIPLVSFIIYFLSYFIIKKLKNIKLLSQLVG
jgi:surface polysaccharide O-acyltransferase-like enzyme